MNFCMYFDKNYLDKGIACLNSLLKYNNNLTCYVLCLDDITKNVVMKKNNVVAIDVKEIEDYFSILKKLKKERSNKEYCATLSPLLPLYIFDKYKIDTVFYTDADICFFSDPLEIEGVFGDSSILITSHENTLAFSAGIFNVGILGYRNDNNCREFLNWWKDKCVDWCKWEMSKGRFADQGYLDIFYKEPEKFKNFIISDHYGINLGPWNVCFHKVYGDCNKIKIDVNVNLVCYHFHGVKENGNSFINETGWEVSKEVLYYVYSYYYEMILQARNYLDTL